MSLEHNSLQRQALTLKPQNCALHQDPIPCYLVIGTLVGEWPFGACLMETQTWNSGFAPEDGYVAACNFDSLASAPIFHSQAAKRGHKYSVFDGVSCLHHFAPVGIIPEIPLPLLTRDGCVLTARMGQRWEGALSWQGKKPSYL